MKEKEFRKLLDKSINGPLSEEERLVLEQFQERLAAGSDAAHFKSQSDKVRLKESLWLNINKELNTAPKLKRESWKMLASIAAVFVGLLAIGYGIHNKQSVDSFVPKTTNVITLELEDGTIKILEEDGSANVFNNSGSLVGRQNKNQLVYTESNPEAKQLVYNTLTIPYGRTFELLLSDGTKAHLNAGSSLKYPVQFLKGNERHVFVTGEVFLDVAKDKDHPFIVNADNLNIKVFGTRFNVNAYPEDGVSEVVLVEGSVGLYSNHDKEEGIIKRLEPGYKASFNKKSEDITTDEVITDIYTSWMNGELVFRNMTFDNILKKLERQYDVKIINNNTNLSKEKFNASFGESPALEEVLKELKATYHLDFEVKENTITIK